MIELCLRCCFRLHLLAFPAAPSPGGPQRLGDVIIAYETVKREAAAEGKPFADHLSHLAVHGFLRAAGAIAGVILE